MSRVAMRLHRAAAGLRLATPPSGELTAQKLTALTSKRILFGHQSVGGNMVDGIPALYSAYSVSPPTMISNLSQINNASGGFFAEFYVGTNGDPVGKTADFNTTVRQYAGKLDIALMKFCFIDIVQGVNVTQVFNAYKSVMDGLTHDFPAIKFVYTTAALDEYNVANAVTREQLNTLIRGEYAATGRLFDLAAVESTAPGGTRVGGTSGGNQYYQSYGGYTSDGAHLNTTGAQVVDKALFTLLASL